MSLNHSNIVQVLDLGEAEGRYFLALELVDGWTLDRILKRSKAAGVPIPPALALYVTAEVCRALGYAHAKKRSDGKPLGIVHRDVSPHNVMMSAEGEVKLTDFGIAKAQNKTEKSLGNLIKGKVAFMSPEQAAGGELDGRSDLFSVGTMLYAMITRRHPFDAPTDYETLMLVKNGDFLPPETARPGLNPELYRVIRKAMGKTADARYQKAEEMLVDVEQVMRVAFRPVGQTELQRWLADLSAKDGVPTLTREAPPEPPASRSIVGPPVEARSRSHPIDRVASDRGHAVAGHHRELAHVSIRIARAVLGAAARRWSDGGHDATVGARADLLRMAPAAGRSHRDRPCHPPGVPHCRRTADARAKPGWQRGRAAPCRLARSDGPNGPRASRHPALSPE